MTWPALGATADTTIGTSIAATAIPAPANNTLTGVVQFLVHFFILSSLVYF
jgi:hypothetical protein